MKTIKVGAFEAKTHLSKLLDEVEQGAIVRITRHGHMVAVLKQDDAVSKARAVEALHALRNRCTKRISMKEVIGMREEGRKR